MLQKLQELLAVSLLRAVAIMVGSRSWRRLPPSFSFIAFCPS